MLKHVTVRHNYDANAKWFIMYTPVNGKAYSSYGQSTVPTHEEIEMFLRNEAYFWNPEKPPETATVTITGFAEEQIILGDNSSQEYYYSPTWDCYMPCVPYSEMM